MAYIGTQRNRHTFNVIEGVDLRANKYLQQNYEVNASLWKSIDRWKELIVTAARELFGFEHYPPLLLASSFGCDIRSVLVLSSFR